MSTVGPDAVRRQGERRAAAGAQVIDAPWRAAPRAKRGELVIFAATVVRINPADSFGPVTRYAQADRLRPARAFRSTIVKAPQKGGSMISCKRHLWVGGMLAATLLYVPMTYAQLGNLLDQGKNAAAGGGLDNLGGMGNGLSLDSLSSGSTGNVAGVLEYCIKNNYLGGGASPVKDGLMSKLGGSASSNGGYLDGAKGILDSGNGKQVDLSGGGLKEQVTKQVCDKILAQGQSLL